MTHEPPHAPLPSFCELSGITGRLTPGMIRSSVSAKRLVVLSRHQEFSAGPAGADSTAQCVRMMALLQTEELRALARGMRVADDGRFIDVFRRLAERC